ncbi:MAG: class I SAM-dependent methyltransferase [Proteobacteria bacterium]|nr:class I SAM-dependent methyltransferase [Pseudomonadota bacterium]MBU4470430.1 class I SAM-dependent methyltransferase [Pseudomonadota bacterium]MCG2753483.1 class I SAM-dependent methyltransferase [Desulfobacteraceae bacterium]
MKKKYTFNVDNRIWRSLHSSTIQYSDGSETEDYLFNLLKSAKDVSSISSELNNAIQDWPSEYHLSRVRHNLLRPFNIKKNHKILELGCGCGAMTRYLGEIGASVIAVEGSHKRSMIAAERCRDLPNVNIYCDNIKEFNLGEKFDYVTLIGVLEYAPVYIQSDDPVKTCLEIALSFLKEDGILILAIENQLGLKYFNGCAEDHTCIPYFGINNCYNKFTPVTFARSDLNQKLNDAGFCNSTFFYPFPDYKVPRILLAHEALTHPSFNVPDFLCTMASRDYSGNPYRAFHEGRVWPLLARNSLIEDLANSFLVISSRNIENHKHIKKTPWLAASYTTDRHPSYATETCIVESPNKALEVIKSLIYPEATKASNFTGNIIHQPQAKSPYFYGKLLLAELQDSMATHGDISIVLKPWFEFLKAQSVNRKNSATAIPGKFLDCIPRNLVLDEYGKCNFFDEEWIFDRPIPMLWVIIRGIVSSLESSIKQNNIIGMTLRNFVTRLLADCEIKIEKEDWLLIEKMETDLQNHVRGYPIPFSYQKHHDQIITNETSFLCRINHLENEVKGLKLMSEPRKFPILFRIVKKLMRRIRGSR